MKIFLNTRGIQCDGQGQAEAVGGDKAGWCRWPGKAVVIARWGKKMDEPRQRNSQGAVEMADQVGIASGAG